MHTIDLLVGMHIEEAFQLAIAEAAATKDDVEFTFNGDAWKVSPSTTLGDLKAEYDRRNGHPLLSREAMAEEARADRERIQKEWAEAIAAAGVDTELQMQAAKVPWPKSLEELTAYIKSLVDRPHDYGTCVYAMSMSAVAAYQFVAHALGTTGFQAGLADLDIIRRTRGYERFGFVDFGNLLYPQYCNAEKFSHWDELLESHEDLRKWVVEQAGKNLAESKGKSHPAVLAHWQMLVDRFGG